MMIALTMKVSTMMMMMMMKKNKQIMTIMMMIITIIVMMMKKMMKKKTKKIMTIMMRRKAVTILYISILPFCQSWESCYNIHHPSPCYQTPMIQQQILFNRSSKTHHVQFIIPSMKLGDQGTFP